MRGQIVKTMGVNFLIWLIPTILFLAVSIVVISILMVASADMGSSGSDKKDRFEKWPKGLIGSLGIGFILSGLTCILSFFYFENIEAEGAIYIIGLALVCFLFGYWGVKYDYRRLKAQIPEN